jgi:hypothetical protein
MSPWSRRAIRRLADCGQGGLESGLPRRATVRADPGHDACVCAGSWTPLRGEFDSDCGIGPDGPGLDVIGIRPHEVAEAAFVRNLLPPINQPHLVDRAELWRESTVHTQDAAVHDGGEGAPARRRRRRGGGGADGPNKGWVAGARQGTNQIVPCSTSTGSRSRTCAGIRRKTRRPV